MNVENAIFQNAQSVYRKQFALNVKGIKFYSMLNVFASIRTNLLIVKENAKRFSQKFNMKSK